MILASPFRCVAGVGGLASGAIFPDQMGAFKKGELKTIGVPDQALYNEYGLDAAEQAAIRFGRGPVHGIGVAVSGFDRRDGDV